MSQLIPDPKAALVAHVRLRPGLKLTAVPTILGWNNTDHARQQADKLVALLEQQGDIAIAPESLVYPYKRLFDPKDSPSPIAPESALQKKVRKVTTSHSKKQAESAIAQQVNRDQEEIGSPPPPGEAEVKDWEEKVADLEQRNRELRQSISEALPRASTLDPRTWLDAQIHFWRAKEVAIEEELEQLLLDLNAVQTNLAAAERLLSLEDDCLPDSFNPVETFTPKHRH